MSKFDGCIQELPYISVDNFTGSNCQSTMFFLSHCHTDHMRGLRDDPFISHMEANPTYKLFCSGISKLILSTFPELKKIMAQVEGYQYGHYKIDVPAPNQDDLSYPLKFAIAPAGHCPGSVMFIFQPINRNIIYSGDFRYSIGETRRIEYFHDENGAVLPIDKIYLDCTFFSPDYYWGFPDRNNVIKEIISLIRGWLTADSNNYVRLEMPANYGGEITLKRISEAFSCRVCILSSVYEMWQRVPYMRDCLTKQCYTTRIHCKIRTKNDMCLKKNQEDKHRLVLRSACASCFCRQDEPMIECVQEKKNVMLFNYSSHCSYSELKDFIEYLKPKEIHDCTGVHSRANNISPEETRIELDKLLSLWDKTKRPYYNLIQKLNPKGACVRMAITSCGYPRTKLMEDEGASIMDKINGLLQRAESYEEDWFDCYYMEAGAMIIPCKDEIAADWLRENVIFLNSWKEPSLKVHPVQKLLRTADMLATIPESYTGDLKSMLRELKRQNNLNTEHWKYELAETAGKVRMAVFNVDEASFDRLDALAFRAQLGLSKIKFTILRRCHEDP